MDASSTLRASSTIVEPVASVEPSKNALGTLYGAIASHMARVEQRFAQELQSPYESLIPLLRHGTQLGGKRLRPAMLLLCAEASGAICEDHIVLGAVIEMIHTATLIHDDVLDDAVTRRHVATINAKWNNHTSILLGDYLFAQGFRLAATLSSTEACQWIGEASRLVCEGEMRQVLMRDVLDLDEATYFEMIQAKTAELCRIACYLGAKFAGAPPEVVEGVSRYGNSLGIAFQIADDFLDIWGDNVQVGKTLGTDLDQGKMTLPLIRLLETIPSSDRRKVINLLKDPSQRCAEVILPWLDRSDAKQYTHQVARDFQVQAIESLQCLRPSKAKESLIEIAHFAVDRKF